MPNGQENAVNALRRAALLAQKAGLTESQIREAINIPKPEGVPNPPGGIHALTGEYPSSLSKNPFRPKK
jgi:hypothetical protein